MNIKALALTAAATVALTSTASFANETMFSNEDIFGRSTYVATVLLAEQGIDAHSVEAWGDVVRVETADADGSTKLIFVDKDTLRPITR